MIENTVYRILSSIPALVGLIDGKVYYQYNRNQDEAQYLIYQKASHIRPLNIDGSPGLENTDFQIDIYSKDEITVRAIRDILVTTLHGQSNNQYAEAINHMYVESDFSGYDPENSVYRITITLSIYF